MYLENISLEFDAWLQQVASYYGKSISFASAKHVDLDTLELSRASHILEKNLGECPACFRTYIPRHRKPMPGTLEYAQWVQDTYYEDI